MSNEVVEIPLKEQIVSAAANRYIALRKYQAKRAEMKTKGASISQIQLECEELRQHWLKLDSHENSLVDDYTRKP